MRPTCAEESTNLADRSPRENQILFASAPKHLRSHHQASKEAGMAAEEGCVIACHTKEDFDANFAKGKDTGKLVIIDFTASWCGPCRVIAPVFAEYAKKFPGAIFLKVDVDELKDVAEKYQVEAMPTFLFIKDGEKVDTVVGGRKDEIHKKLVELTSAPASASA